MVSIHAPTRGATSLTQKGAVKMAGFNPRAHTGRDAHTLEVCINVVVSIHAPTRGATYLPVSKLDKGIVSIHAPTRGATNFFISSFVFFLFQSTRPHGARPGAYDLNKLAKGFQSTRPHGARLQKRLHSSAPITCFNPRAHTGRDINGDCNKNEQAVSIHAPTRGATFLPCSVRSSPRLFQSTRPHGARLLRWRGKIKK